MKTSFVSGYRIGIIISIILVSFFFTWLGWRLSGGNLYFVSTPSMGQTMPVGSLVVTQDVTNFHSLRVGQIIVYRLLDTNDYFVHRIYSVLPDGRFKTKGDLEALADPLIVSDSQIVGRVVQVIPAIGWIYRLSGYLFLVAISMLFLSFFAPLIWRSIIYVLCPLLFVGVPLVLFHPLVSAQVLETNYNNHLVEIDLVDTGILPVSYHCNFVPSVSGSPGQLVKIVFKETKATSPGHLIPIGIKAKLSWWIVIVLITLCALPVVFYLFMHSVLKRHYNKSSLSHDKGQTANKPALL